MKRLKKYASKYEKNFNIFPIIQYNVQEAIKRAEKLEKYQLESNKQIGTVEANPNTEAYKVVNYLLQNQHQT